ncbi:MFS transporter [Vreelandella titanicae]
MVVSATTITVAVPSIMDQFGMSQQQVQWLVTGFLASMTSSMLSLAWLVDAFGQRLTFVVGFFVFIVASLLGGFAPSAEAMTVARVIQGAAAGVVQPLAIIVIFQVFPPRQRGLGMGIYGMGVLLGPAIGPTVGGVLVDAWSWRGVFFLTLPFCGLGVLLGLLFLPARLAKRPSRAFDWNGLLLLVTALVSLLWSFANGDRLGWSSPLILGLLTLATTSSLAFVAWELRSRRPMLNLQVFLSRDMVLGAVLMFAHGASLYGTTYLIPLFMQHVQGVSATGAGAVLVPAGLLMALTFPFGGYLGDHVPPRFPAVIALVCLAVSAYLLTLADAETSFWWMAAWVALGRLGLGILNPPLTIGALRSLPDELLAHGSGALSFARQLGATFGVNLLAVLLAHRIAFHTDALRVTQADVGWGIHQQAQALGFHDTFLILSLVLALGLVPAWLIGQTAKGNKRQQAVSGQQLRRDTRRRKK